jgi:hypothetical protein
MATTLNDKTFAQLFTAAGGANGTRVNAQGRIEAAATPAFDYDPITLVAQGLLFRGPARANLLTNSQLSTLGVGEGLTPPTVGTATVDGEPCASVTFTSAMTPGYTGSRWRPSNSSAPIATTNAYSQSAYVKLSRPLVGNEGLTVYYTGASGMGTFAITAANSAPYAERFTRIETPKITPAANGTVYPVVHINTAVGSNLTVWICKGQVEIGPTVSGYIPTMAAALTRSVDVVTIPNVHLAPWFNPVEGTFVVDFDIFAQTEGGQQQGLLTIARADNTSYLAASVQSNGGVIIQAPGLNVSTGAGLVPVGAQRRVAFSYKVGQKINLSVGGAAANQSAANFSAFTGSALDLRLGTFVSNPGPLTGRIKNFLYWPKAANAVELASLTPETEAING